MKNNIQIKTLTRKDIEKLLVGRKDDFAISFYVGIRSDQNFLSVINSFISEKLKEIEKEDKLVLEKQRKIRKTLENMEKTFRSIRLPDKTRTFVIFCTFRGKCSIFKLPVYIPTKLVVEKDFYIHPFIKSLEKYPRYCVVFLERDRARIFDLFWGELDHKTREFRSEVPQRMNAARATWKGLEERKIQNHIEVHINRHLVKVAREVERYMDKNRIPYLVIGSRRELIERFRNFLPKNLQAKIIGSYLVRTDQDIKNIQKRSLEVIENFERNKEERLVDIFVAENSKKAKGAVWGVENVLGYLRDYQIHLLAVGKNYHVAGYVCKQNHHPFFRTGVCPVCGSDGDVVEDIVDEIIEEAIKQKIEIVHFQFLHDNFDRFGLGAILK